MRMTMKQECLEDYMYIGKLLSLYGGLLENRNQKMMERYYFDNISFSEISEEFDISRQRAHQIIDHERKYLKGIEKTLALSSKFDQIEGLYLRYKTEKHPVIEELGIILDQPGGLDV